MSCDYFQFTDQSDSFQTWQGLRGPKGDPGPEGPPGQGLVIQGIVATVGDLPASANQGDVYLVGASDPYEGYLWTDGAWEDIGELAMGPQGPAGTITVGTVSGLPAGSTPTVVNTGTAEAAVLDFGIPAGADGAPGQDGQDGAPGPGVAAGGTAGQILAKASGTDYDTEWIDPPKNALYFQSVACSAMTGNFATISNAAITVNHVVASIVFANPSAITSDVTWTTASGSLTLNGTCASATTADVVLVLKIN